MDFRINLILPTSKEVNMTPSLTFPGSDLLDDDPERPIFLLEVGDVFEANRVRFEVIGFFVEPLPVSTRDDLPYFLESLPGLLRFLGNASLSEHTIGFWGQGIETKFSLFRLNENEIEVRCLCFSDRKMLTDLQKTSIIQLKAWVLIFVSNYKEALKRYLPNRLVESWNRDVFNMAEQHSHS